MKKLWITLKCGLIEDPKHRRAMGEAFWLYAYMLNSAEWETGIVHGWKDAEIGRAIEMPARTVLEYRRRLADKGYITCKQNQYSQDITIHNWTNPREYTGRVYNRKGDTQAAPSTNQGNAQGDMAPKGEDVTPTYSPKNKDQKEEKAATPRANTIPEVVLYRKVTKLYPPAEVFDVVVAAVQRVRARLGREVVVEDLLPFRQSWVTKGYNRFAVTWLEWAEAGKIPQNGNWKPKEPQGVTAAHEWLEGKNG